MPRHRAGILWNQCKIYSVLTELRHKATYFQGMILFILVNLGTYL